MSYGGPTGIGYRLAGDMGRTCAMPSIAMFARLPLGVVMLRRASLDRTRALRHLRLLLFGYLASGLGAMKLLPVVRGFDSLRVLLACRCGAPGLWSGLFGWRSLTGLAGRRGQWALLRCRETELGERAGRGFEMPGPRFARPDAVAPLAHRLLLLRVRVALARVQALIGW